MDQKLVFQLIGGLLMFAGFLLVYNPELVSDKPIPEDTFRAIERRVWWGLLIGLGMLLMFHHQIKPYQLTLAATAISLTSGVLIARIMGVAFDGSVPRQWMWIVVELVMVIAFVFWYWYVLKRT